MSRFVKTFTAFAILVLAGCASVGPRTITRDRFDYVNAISDSWKRQTLLNIVKIRYSDSPFFLDVSQVVSSYSLGHQIDLSATWSDALIGDSQGVGGSATYVDRPTIIYNPLLGRDFTRQIMTPISPSAVFSLIQAGYPADAIMRICAVSINGVRNRITGELRARPADPEFFRLLELLTHLQKTGTIGTRIDLKDKGKEGEVVSVFFRDDADEDIIAKSREVRELLGLSQEAKEFNLIFAAVPENDREIAMLSRSMFEILIELSPYVEVPAEHVDNGWAYSSPIEEIDARPLIRIRSGTMKPEDAFVAVSYNDYWFWIEKGDHSSKRMLTFIMILFSLAEPEAKTQPTVTIPTR